MISAGRSPVLPNVSQEHAFRPEREDLAAPYLDAAEGNPSLALRLAADDRVSDLERFQARVRQLQALVSPGFARWGKRDGER